MPKMDGYECSQKIREFERDNFLPKSYIVGLSGDDSMDHRKKCKLHEMDEALCKPVNRDQLE